jgi:hypothetical protein
MEDKNLTLAIVAMDRDGSRGCGTLEKMLLIDK